MDFKITLLTPPNPGDEKLVALIGFEKSIVHMGIGTWAKYFPNGNWGFIMEAGGWAFPSDGIMHSDIPKPTDEEIKKFKQHYM